ncbi:MAG TPA: PEP/pyruvate-binding domain-containing protein [Phycisphaerae bacterium]|nr:PEP/pyruvate-binding domain-containing protein [Phycisphaerae bacterium]HRW54328.1 PEP/pyruvate-binding domain-containing protein [Phycisphaerae bacterium]
MIDSATPHEDDLPQGDSINMSPTAERLEEHLTLYPHLADRILRQLLVVLHEQGVISIDTIYDEARRQTGNIDAGRTTDADNPNVMAAPRGDQTERDVVQSITRKYAAERLRPQEIDEIVNLTLKREEADKLRAIVSLQSVSFRLLADTVRRFCALPVGEMQLTPDEATGIRVGLIRHLISDQLEFIAIAKKYLRIRDFEGIINRTIGAESGMGRVGGKAAGMYLAATILGASRHQGSRKRIPAEPASDVETYTPSAIANDAYPVAIPDSYYLRSDVIEDFLAFNGLGEYQNQKYKLPEEIRNEYRLIKSVFRNADFPAGIVEQLRDLLEKLGESPLIVRSSSLLEDRFGTAFSGKYASIFVANQGRIEHRLEALLGAIAEVFASALGPDPLQYRKEHDLLDYEEDMAVLIQRVIGKRFGPYFAPAFAGVAFSRNEFRWSPRIRREDGLARLVMGLGTRAVDRVAGESPRLVALGVPTLRHESTNTEIMCNSQREIDVINVERNCLEAISLPDLLAHAGEFPMLDRCVSIRKERLLVPPMGTYIDEPASNLFITFDKLMSEGIFTDQLRVILRRLEEAYGYPVDVEFAHDGETLYLLQCRTLSQGTEFEPQPIPENVAQDKTVFTATRFVRSGRLEGVEYIVYVDPRDYDEVGTREDRIEIARVIGRLNNALANKRFILIGPGRWGSNDMRLGIPVTYADINRSSMLIEVAREREGYVPEVSYGTHFFQDLVEAKILYLPLYPDDSSNQFNEPFLSNAENSLISLVPSAEAYRDIIRVIHVPSVAHGAHVSVFMNGEEDRALAFLSDGRE